VAREAVALDQLSGGRLILGVGLGEPPDLDFAWFGEEPAPAARAAKLDEALTVLAGLWSGQPFGFQGEHYQVHETTFLPTPAQRPRIPIWVGGRWPNRRPLRRAARWDGLFPFKVMPDGMPDQITPDEVRQLTAYVRAHRASKAPFEVVISGETPAGDPAQAAALLAPYAAAGLTWWQEAIHGFRGSLAEMQQRIVEGPPRL
jgi:alkanesulfonate monooxygenase SsuD/methylene tetrahydromethanopterin reductase-like flavin-dependent oxidoreductase (luciferase family)